MLLATRWSHVSGKRHRAGRTVVRRCPRRTTADSRARVTVVPTATTRPPARLVSFTIRAVVGVTSNHSGGGASPAS